MALIRQHIPAFIDGLDVEQGEFATLDELTRIPFVRRWTQLPGFYRLSIGDHLLMAEMDNGAKWWVVGRIAGEVPAGLPTWKYPAQ